jgi:hypothetical protein
MTSELQEKPLKREHPAVQFRTYWYRTLPYRVLYILHNHYFLFKWVVFALLDPDPGHSQCGSGFVSSRKKKSMHIRTRIHRTRIFSTVQYSTLRRNTGMPHCFSKTKTFFFNMYRYLHCRYCAVFNATVADPIRIQSFLNPGHRHG